MARDPASQIRQPSQPAALAQAGLGTHEQHQRRGHHRPLTQPGIRTGPQTHFAWHSPHGDYPGEGCQSTNIAPPPGPEPVCDETQDRAHPVSRPRVSAGRGEYPIRTTAQSEEPDVRARLGGSARVLLELPDHSV
jgi:hypothetical protein